VFDAIVAATMQDEEELARTFVESSDPASDRLLDMLLALHRRKRERFEGDPEVYALYKRIVQERPDLVRNYAEAITRPLAAILADGVRKRQFKIDDVDAAAEVVRDAVTIYVHPAHVEAAARAGISMEPSVRRMIATLVVALKKGLSLRDVG
jgi:hypothetical protein